MQKELDNCFKLLLNLPDAVLQAVAEQTMAGILNLLKLNSPQYASHSCSFTLHITLSNFIE
jgi:hypothetical protein